MESEGFLGSKKGLSARVYETFTVLILVAVLVLGMTYIMSALIDGDISKSQTLFSELNFNGVRIQLGQRFFALEMLIIHLNFNLLTSLN